MERTTILLVGAVFVSACSVTSTHTYNCDKEEECERRAEEICRSKNYSGKRIDFKPPNKARPLSERTGASDITGALGQGMGGSKNYATDEDRPRWQYTVECNPTPSAEAHASVTTIYPELTPEQLAARENYIAMYMRAVCELTDPDMRREELETARREFGDVSCD